MADNTFNAPLSPIQRSTPSQNVIAFQRNESSIYNKYSPYYQAGGQIGFDQPYVYVKLTDSNLSKNLTAYDTQALPIGSTIRDLQRMTKFSLSKSGVIYLGKQLLLQQQNPFNETRIYNPLSLLKATAKPTSLGAIGYPQRHLETSGGLLNFFKDALLSTFGMESKSLSQSKIEGTASGEFANYANKKGSARYGLMRYQTGSTAASNFNVIWASNGEKNQAAGGFLSRLASGLVDKLRKMIPSTNPLGAFGGSTGETWKYRPEYASNQLGIYHVFLDDKAGMLKSKAYNIPRYFYNDVYAKTGQSSTQGVIGDVGPNYYHKYRPAKDGTDDPYWTYAPKTRVQRDDIGAIDTESGQVVQDSIKDRYKRMLEILKPYNETDGGGQFRLSAERYSENPKIGITDLNNYKSIPGTSDKVEKSGIADGPFVQYLRSDGDVVNSINIDNRGFAKASKKNKEFGTSDAYNMLLPTKNKNDIFLAQGSNQSKDLIFFYFYDIINKTYIPFRATLGSVSDQHSPEWEDIKYIGRADKLFIYKGFSREVSFSFKVYANSVDELIPMWKRINYLTGLTRPSKYTGKAVVTNSAINNREQNIQQNLELAELTGDQGNIDNLSQDLQNMQTTGLESGFIYPPMVEFRIGDMYVDQPGIIRSVNISIPDDAQWETLRDEEYKYVYGVEKTLTKNAKSRQLPTIVDISVQLSIIERQQSITGMNVFGPEKGWDQLQ